MRRWIAGAAALIVVVVALLLALGGSLNRTSRHDAGGPRGTGTATIPGATSASTHPGATSTSASTTGPPALPTSADGSAGPAAATLQRAIGRAIGPDGAQTGAFVYDLTAHRTLVALRPSVARPPASVEKLWTTTAVLDRLGPSTRLHTAVLGAGHRRGSTWHGDLYLRGGGDPTFGDPGFNRIYNGGAGSSMTALVAMLRRAGIRRVTGTLYADDTLFDRRRGGLITDYKPDVPDFGGYLSALVYDHGTTAPHYGTDPASFAAHVMAQSMRAAGIAVHAARRPRRTPDSAVPLAEVRSPPVAAMTRLMDVPSDDLYAELFAKQLGVLFGHGGSIASGAKVIGATIAGDYHLHPRILDGSGLDRADRTSPIEIVTLLRDLWHTPTGRELAASLPTVGVDGTVEGIAPRTPAKGRCLAKTGTLDGVTNLAGYCSSRGGHELAFGLFVDGPDNATAFTGEGRMVAAIATY